MFSTTLRQFGTASLASALLVISPPANASAQTAAAPQWLRFNVETVKPDMVQEYEGYKKQLAAAYKKAGQPVYAVLSSYSGNRNEYTTVTFVMKFGDLDNPSPIQKALGDEAFTNLVGAIARCVTSTTWYFSVPWDDVSIDKASSLGPYFLRTRVPIATGKNADYRAYVKNELRPVLEKGGVTWYRASAPTFGGPAGTVETMRMLKNLGEIDGGPIQTRVLGAAGAQALAAKVASLTRGPAQNTILRLRPELSLLPPAMPAK
jgi:hypothetical protein